MDRNDLRRLAEIGAGHRLAELDQERAALVRQFPGLKGPSTTSSRKAKPSNGGVGAVGSKAPRKRRSAMSAAARRAVSARMKKYWADRRKAKTAKIAKS